VLRAIRQPGAEVFDRSTDHVAERMRISAAWQEALHLQGKEIFEQDIVESAGSLELPQELRAAHGVITEQLVEQLRNLKLVKLTLLGIEQRYLVNESTLVLV
jgi:hypothetical protein